MQLSSAAAASSCSSSLLLLLLLIVLSSKSAVAAYSNEMLSKHNVFHHHRAKCNRRTYNLGLGRNPPVRNAAGYLSDDASSSSSSSSSVSEATKFLVDHEGLIEREKFFVSPAPMMGHRETHTASPTLPVAGTQPSNNNQHKVPVLGSRITDDSDLHIQRAPAPNKKADERQDAHFVQAHGRNLKRRYDLNTAWVEMLIHSEQQRAAAVNAAATAT